MFFSQTDSYDIKVLNHLALPITAPKEIKMAAAEKSAIIKLQQNKTHTC